MTDTQSTFRPVPYLTHPLQRLLDEKSGRPEGPNVGYLGEHLTIAFNLGRTDGAEALLRSIETTAGDFKGEILVLHGPEQARAASQLERALAGSRLRIRFLPVSGSTEGARRNAAVEAAATTWLMWLGPGLRFAWNVIQQLQRDIAQLGCRFINLRVYDPAKGDVPAPWHLVLDSDHHHPGVRLEDDAGAGDGALLVTAITGLACAFNIERFRALGRYDEGLPGLEDLDLSIRLFEAGYKVGVSSERGLQTQPGVTASLETHAAASVSAVSAEVARGFERKFGLRPSGAAPSDPSLASSPLWGERDAGDRRPKVALIVDLDDWAFANISRQLARSLSDRFHFEIIPLVAIQEIPQVLMLCEGADLIHFFWREVLRSIHTEFRTHVDAIGVGFDYYIERFASSKVKTTAVYDHLFLEGVDVPNRRNLFATWSDSYYVCSQKLYDIYAAIPGYPRPGAVLPDGVDLRVFRPRNLDRFENMGHRPISVGWVGNSGWASHLGDPKGVHTILKPAVKELAAEGIPVVENFADRVLGMIPHAQMPAYYGGIDVLVCTSEIEGTPNPVLEAMACGVPVVTTDVGVVQQALGPQGKEFILPVRSVEALKDALRRLHAERSLFAELSRENLESIKAWDWPVMAEEFAAFFSRALQKRAVPALRAAS